MCHLWHVSVIGLALPNESVQYPHENEVLSNLFLGVVLFCAWFFFSNYSRQE